ncbi:MAG: hypothetical protein K6357_06325 [Elusimicrobiota bacterium]
MHITKNILFLCLLFLILFPNLVFADKKPENIKYQWNYPVNTYFILPTTLRLEIASQNETKKINQWGFGFSSIGWEGFSMVTGLELKGARVELKNDSTNFYIFDLILGVKYILPETKRRFWITSSFAGEFGVSGSNVFITQVISAGIILPNKNIIEPIYSSNVINGFSIDIFYTPFEIDFDEFIDGNKAILKPHLGIKFGYIFEGFWTQKIENKK